MDEQRKHEEEGKVGDDGMSVVRNEEGIGRASHPRKGCP